jgi:hypothetical protein
LFVFFFLICSVSSLLFSFLLSLFPPALLCHSFFSSLIFMFFLFLWYYSFCI